MLLTRLIYIFFLFILFITKSTADPIASDCHPEPSDPPKTQYIIAYGSLMQTKSKNSTDNTSGKNIPVSVDHYKRGWFAEGKSIGLSTTYLGVIKKPISHFNGAIFRLASADFLKKYDNREKYYCRVCVSPGFIHRLDKQPLPPGEFWIYELKPEFYAPPSEKYPLTESYVDIFLAGCIEIQEKYHLQHFAEECITTTSDWSEHWVNDRVYLRRPFVFQPYALKIDTLLAKKQSALFQQIKLES